MEASPCPDILDRPFPAPDPSQASHITAAADAGLTTGSVSPMISSAGQNNIGEGLKEHAEIVSEPQRQIEASEQDIVALTPKAGMGHSVEAVKTTKSETSVKDSRDGKPGNEPSVSPRMQDPEKSRRPASARVPEESARPIPTHPGRTLGRQISVDSLTLSNSSSPEQQFGKDSSRIAKTPPFRSRSVIPSHGDPERSTATREVPHGGISPCFIFLQLYNNNWLGKEPDRPIKLPPSEVRTYMSVGQCYYISLTPWHGIQSSLRFKTTHSASKVWS